MIRVIVIDDQPVARRGLMWILSGAADIDVVAEAADPASVVGDNVAADVVVCDPFPAGAARRLGAVRELSARAAVLVWSASRDATDVFAAMRAGAKGYLTKAAEDHTYLSAVRRVASGGVYLPAPWVGLTRPSRARDLTATRIVLSEREREALAYVGRGFTHAQTARRMGVSKATVDTYIGRVRAKLRVGNKAELALAALQYVGHPELLETATHRG